MNIFDQFITRPFGIVLYFLYEIVKNYGIALILFTIFTKLVILPFQAKSKKGMLDMQRIQPKLKELEKKYKNDKERYGVEMQKLYKEEGVSMFGGCLPLLLTIPIMFALYAVIRRPLTFMFGYSLEQMTDLVNQFTPQLTSYAEGMKMTLANLVKSNAHEIFLAKANNLINFNFLGLDLSITPTLSNPSWLWLVPILSGATSYLYSFITKKYQPAPDPNQPGASTANTMTLLMPLMSVYIAFVVPAGLGLYWILSNILSIIQEPILHNYYVKRQKPTTEKPSIEKPNKIIDVEGDVK